MFCRIVLRGGREIYWIERYVVLDPGLHLHFPVASGFDITQIFCSPLASVMRFGELVKPLLENMSLWRTSEKRFSVVPRIVTLLWKPKPRVSLGVVQEISTILAVIGPF